MEFKIINEKTDIVETSPSLMAIRMQEVARHCNNNNLYEENRVIK